MNLTTLVGQPKATEAGDSPLHFGLAFRPSRRALGLRLVLGGLALVGLVTSAPAAPVRAGWPPLTGTCGCTSADTVTCRSLHDCTVPRYNCDHINGTRANNRTDCTINFPLTAGTHYLWDADLQVVTTLATNSVRLNYGTRRVLNGYPVIMAWSAPGTDGLSHTGWILAQDIAEDMSWMPTVAPATPSAPQLEARAMHAATNRAYYLTSDGSQSLKVTTSCGDGGQWATDYLDKDGGRAVQVYNTPGWGAGSPTMEIVHVGTGKAFYRDANIPHVAVSLYDCRSGSAVSTGKELWFLYGAVPGASPARYGWMAYPLIN